MGSSESKIRGTGRKDKEILIDSLIHANTFFFFVGVKDKRKRERSTGGNEQDRQEDRQKKMGNGEKRRGKRARKSSTA